MQHKKGDAGSYKAFKEDRKHHNGKLTPEQTANGTDFTDIQARQTTRALYVPQLVLLFVLHAERSTYRNNTHDHNNPRR